MLAQIHIRFQLFFSMWILILWYPLVLPCVFHTLVFPVCMCLPIISKRRSSSFILLLRKLSTSCIPRTKSAGKSNSYTICAKKLFKKVILRMWFSIALSNVTKLNKLALNWSEDVKELSFLIFLVEVIPLSGPGFLPSFSFYSCLDSKIILCIPLIFVTNNNLIISPVSLKFKKCSQKTKKVCTHKSLKSVYKKQKKVCTNKSSKSIYKNE